MIASLFAYQAFFLYNFLLHCPQAFCIIATVETYAVLS